MGKVMTKEEWRRKKRRKRRGSVLLGFLMFTGIMILIALCVKEYQDTFGTPNENETITGALSNGVEIQRDYLTPNQYSRPQKDLDKVKGIVIHYTANPGTSAKNNRSYFQGLASSGVTYASSHFVIGLEGEIIQCIPLTEIAYASNNRNKDTISIECCHPDETGKFNDQTYDSLVSLVAKLCKMYRLKEEDIIRHYDVTGKLCPLYYVDHPDAWEKMKEDIMKEVKRKDVVTTTPEKKEKQ